MGELGEFLQVKTFSSCSPSVVKLASDLQICSEDHCTNHTAQLMSHGKGLGLLLLALVGAENAASKVMPVYFIHHETSELAEMQRRPAVAAAGRPAQPAAAASGRPAAACRTHERRTHERRTHERRTHERPGTSLSSTVLGCSRLCLAELSRAVADALISTESLTMYLAM